MDKNSSRSTSQMTLDERREYIAKLRTERQERFGSTSASSSRPSSSQSSRADEMRHSVSPTKELRRSDLLSTSPTPYTQSPPSSLLGMHNTFSQPRATSPLPHHSTSSLSSSSLFPRSTSPVPPNSSSSPLLPRSTFSSSLPPSLATPLVTPNNNYNNNYSNNNNNTFLSSQNFDKPMNTFSSAFSVPSHDPQTSTLDIKQSINSSQRGYNQWADEKLKWWDAEGKRLQSFLTQMDEEWERHRDATRRELEDEIAALKHESLVRANINQASKNLL